MGQNRKCSCLHGTSVVGPSRKLARLNGMSVLPSTADVIGSLRHVRFVPKAEVTASFDHLVGAGEKRRRNLETERFCGLEIDGKQEFDGLLNWKLGRFSAF